MSNYHPTHRENFLMALLNKVVKEYKALLELSRRNKPFKIVDITELSNIPGETCFTIQVTNKNSILHLTAGEIISKKYDLNDFNDFHAELIRQAAKGKLTNFLQGSGEESIYTIVSKKYDTSLKKNIFTIKHRDNVYFKRTAEEISFKKEVLFNIKKEDVYDIGFTHGSESILKEKSALLLAKEKIKESFNE